MSRKSEYSPEEKIKACTEYLSGAKSATDIARKLDMGKRGCGTVQIWLAPLVTCIERSFLSL